MKYFIYFPFFIFIFISGLIGSICWLWGFEKRHFRSGFRFLNNHIRFAEFMDKHFGVFHT